MVVYREKVSAHGKEPPTEPGNGGYREAEKYATSVLFPRDLSGNWREKGAGKIRVRINRCSGEGRLTFKLLAVGGAATLLQQAIYVVVEQTFAPENLIQVDVVVPGRVLLVCQGADHHGEENNRDLDSSGVEKRKSFIKCNPSR